MIRLEPVSLNGFTALAVEVKLPKTTLLAVTTEKGYIMCGAINIWALPVIIKLAGYSEINLVGQAVHCIFYLLIITWNSLKNIKNSWLL